MEPSSAFDLLWFRAVAGLLTGLALGSFATMLSYRLPRRLSIVTPRSHCPVCKTTLQPRELLPVVSWAIQRGKCRTCGTFSGWRYPLIECVTALSVMTAFLLMGFTLLLLLPIALIVTLVTWAAMRLERK